MDWLVSSVISTITASLLLGLSYSYLYWLDRSRYLLLWSSAWAVIAARYAVALADLLVFEGPWAFALNHSLGVWSTVLLLTGALVFTRRLKRLPLLIGLAAAVNVWIVIAQFGSFSTFAATLPASLLRGAFTLAAGVAIIRHAPLSARFEPMLAGGAFIAWGLHQADYPFLQPIAWFAPWGYLLGAGLGFLAGLAIILLYVRLSREQIRANEQRFRQTFDHAAVGITNVATDGRLLLMNKQFCEITGYSCDALETMRFQDITHPDDQEPDLTLMQEMIDGKRDSYSLEKRYLRPDGTVQWISLSVAMVHDAAGRPDHIVSIVEDINRRKATEEALRISRERFQLAMEANRDGLWDWDLTTDNVFYSPGYTAMLGYDTVETPAHINSWLDCIHPDDREHALGVNRDCIENRRDSFEVEFRMQTKHGEWKWILGRGKAVSRDETGRATRLVGTHTDITERKHVLEALRSAHNALEERVLERTRELQEANDRLMEMDKVKSKFLSTVSHDLRTPLTSIRGFATIIRKDFEHSFASLAEGEIAKERRRERIRTNLDVILMEGERLTRLINDFLDLSRIEEGRWEWRDEEADMNKVLQDAGVAASSLFYDKPDVAFTMELPGNLPALRIDQDRITQVLSNLLNNAAKFTAAGRVTLSAASGDGWLTVCVGDTGVGIGRADAARIFDKFYQIGGDTLETHKGSGMGLAICKEIVKRHGGELWVDSTPGQGSTFCFRLPVPAADGP